MILKEENIDTSHVNIEKDKHSGIAHITVAENGMFSFYCSYLIYIVNFRISSKILCYTVYTHI